MNKYIVYVDLVERNEDWNDDEKIRVIDLEVEAANGEEAREKADRAVAERYPGMEFYVWEVTEDDIID